jgi:D-lactate dehydrogenase
MHYHFSLPAWQEEYFSTNNLTGTTDVFFENSIQESDLSLIRDCEIISVFVHDVVDQKIIDSLPNLKLIVTRSTGFDHIDTKYAKSKNIPVCNVPAYGSDTVAEFAFALLLAITRHIPQITHRSKDLNFKYLDLQGSDLNGKTIGVLGSGKIGRNMIQMAKGFDLKIVVYDIFQDENLAKTYDFEYLPLDEVLSQSDILSVHLPYTKETENLFSRENLSKIKPGCIFLNVARGNLISNENLAWALQEGIFSACGLDTIEDEHKLFEGNATELQLEILKDPRVIFSPHCAYYTKEALQRIIDTSVKDIQEFLGGNVLNQVNL